MNKKIYQAPITSCVAIEHESVLALSAHDLNLNAGGSAPEYGDDDENPIQHFSREDRPSTPDIWDQGW